MELTKGKIQLQSNTLKGEPFDIQSLRGKVVLIEFWGTRCAPCIADQPVLKRIYREYRERGFEIVGICLHAEPERIRRFVDEHELPWVQLCHDKSTSIECNKPLTDRFGVEAVPTTLLIDKDGRVIAQGVRPLHSIQGQDLECFLKSRLGSQ